MCRQALIAAGGVAADDLDEATTAAQVKNCNLAVSTYCTKQISSIKPTFRDPACDTMANMVLEDVTNTCASACGSAAAVFAYLTSRIACSQLSTERLCSVRNPVRRVRLYSQRRPGHHWGLRDEQREVQWCGAALWSPVQDELLGSAGSLTACTRNTFLADSMLSIRRATGCPRTSTDTRLHYAD